jgi:hypothetical protein
LDEIFWPATTRPLSAVRGVAAAASGVVVLACLGALIAAWMPSVEDGNRNAVEDALLGNSNDAGIPTTCPSTIRKAVGGRVKTFLR